MRIMSQQMMQAFDAHDIFVYNHTNQSHEWWQAALRDVEVLQLDYHVINRNS